MRGRVRIATTVSTTRWEMKLPGTHGHMDQLSPTVEVTAVAQSDSQNAATGRARVSSTGTSTSSPHTSCAAPFSAKVAALASSATMPAATTARCGVQDAYSRRRPGRRRVIGPSTPMRGSGR